MRPADEWAASKRPSLTLALWAWAIYLLGVGVMIGGMVFVVAKIAEVAR